MKKPVDIPQKESPVGHLLSKPSLEEYLKTIKSLEEMSKWIRQSKPPY